MCADMKLESGNSALTNSFIHRVERSLMIRTQNNAMRDALRHFKESTGALYRISALSRLPLLAHALKTIKFWHCGASVCTLTSSFAHPSFYPSPPPSHTPHILVSDPTLVGNRHGVLRKRLEGTMNKGTAAALQWAKKQASNI